MKNIETISAMRLPDFIVIDDDSINNTICKIVIKNELPKARIFTFTAAQKGIAHINATYSKPASNDVILLLDIIMPALSGWNVLEILKHSPEEVRQHLFIFILSANFAPEDKQKAANGQSSLISGFITKSFDRFKLQTIIPGHLK